MSLVITLSNTSSTYISADNYLTKVFFPHFLGSKIPGLFIWGIVNITRFGEPRTGRPPAICTRSRRRHRVSDRCRTRSCRDTYSALTRTTACNTSRPCPDRCWPFCTVHKPSPSENRRNVNANAVWKQTLISKPKW